MLVNFKSNRAVKFAEKYAKHLSFFSDLYLVSFSATQIANFINVNKPTTCTHCDVGSCSLRVYLCSVSLTHKKIESCLAVVQTTHLSLTLMHGLSYAYHFSIIQQQRTRCVVVVHIQSRHQAAVA